MSEEYLVKMTVPHFPCEKPYAYIEVAGKIQATPCLLQLKAGDKLIIHRVDSPRQESS